MLRAVVVSFDRLHLGYLGCYGNEWVETPNFDRLAAEAVTFDRHYAETVERVSREHPWWTGAVPFARQDAGQPTLPETLATAGVRTWFVGESDGHDESLPAPAFDEIVEARGRDGVGVSDEQTPFARLVAVAIESLPHIAGHDGPALLWLKSRGVPAPWLPPEQLADLYLDEFGLSPDQSSEKYRGDPFDEPEEVWHADSGQSIDLKYARALYAAYVTHLDRWFGRLIEQLDRTLGRDELLLIVTAAAGEPLGEHGELDVRRDLLREEVVHTPLWVRVPEKSFNASRRSALVQPGDIPPTLIDWFASAPPALCKEAPGGDASGRQTRPLPRAGLAPSPSSPVSPPLCAPAPLPLCKGGAGGVAPPEESSAAESPASQSPGRRVAESRIVPREAHGSSLLPLVRLEVESIRDAAVMANADESGLLTDEYFLVEAASQEIEGADRQRALLFAKPHDRWDQSNIADQFPHVADELRNELRNRLAGARP